MGFSIHVSHAAAQLDEVLTTWRQRPLGTYVYLFLDARYEHVSVDGQVRDAAVLIAAGVNLQGKRELLGVSVALSEQEVHWRSFLQSLVQRGLGGVRLIISDAHTGLQAARQAVFGSIPWQRCQFHLQRNAQAYVPRKSLGIALQDSLYVTGCGFALLFQEVTTLQHSQSPGCTGCLLRGCLTITATGLSPASRR